MTQQDKAELFQRLHRPGDPLILFNVWDAGSAKAVAGAGASAIATGSWSVAAAHGLGDGEELPFELALSNLERIVAAVDLPVTLDLERGYGAQAEDVGRSVASIISSGAVGCNIEDGRAGAEGLVPLKEQVTRLEAASRAASASGIPFFLNARIDVFLRNPAPRHQELLAEAVERAEAYAAAGASGIFVPGLADEKLIERFCASSPKPVNIMAAPGVPAAVRLGQLGVARVSHGPFPYRNVIAYLEDQARTVYR